MVSSTKIESSGIFARLWTFRKPCLDTPQYDRLAEEGYQKNVIVYRCVNLIARGLASVPWLLYERQHNNEHEIEKHPLLQTFLTLLVLVLQALPLWKQSSAIFIIG